MAASDIDKTTRIGVCIAAFGAAFLTPFLVSSVTISLPAIARDLSMGAVAMSWISTAYLLCSTVLLIPFGKLADTYGRKRFFVTGISIITVSSMLSANASGGTTLILTRMLHGVGAAMIFGTGMAMLTSVFPARMRGKMLGINVSFTYLGLTLGPYLGGLLTHHFGWRALFWVNIPVGSIIFIVAMTMVRREWRQEHSTGPFDGAGALLYAASISLVIIGFSKLTHWYGIALTTAGILLGGYFLFVESRARQPILPVSLFLHNRVFACSNLAALINYGATYSIGFLGSLYLQYVKGMPPHAAGLVAIAQPVVMVLVSPLAGRLSDRIEPRIPASFGMGCITVGLLLLSLFDAATTLPRIIGTMMLFGVGFAFFSAPNTSAVMGSVDKGSYGIASATVGTMRLFGQVLSMGLTMLLMSIMIGDGKIIPQQYPVFLRMMYLLCLIFAAASAIGIVVSLVRGDVRKDSRTAT